VAGSAEVAAHKPGRVAVVLNQRTVTEPAKSAATVLPCPHRGDAGRELPARGRLIPERECGCRCVGVAQLSLVVLSQAEAVDLWAGGHPILPAASAPRRMVSDDAMTYLPMLDRSEWPSASAAAARSPVAARNRVAYLARSLCAVKS